MKLFKLAVLSSAIAFAGVATAATDGALGTDSTGTSEVTLIKENAVQISNVGDIDFGTLSVMAADTTVSDDVCVFNSTVLYRVTVSSTNTFELQDGANSIGYDVSWAANGGAAAPVTHATAIDNLTGDDTSLDCGSSTNATFAVSVAAADFNAAPVGSYSDTLTLFVEPM